MKFIKGYKFIYEKNAIDSQKKCNQYYFIPNINGITKNWVNYQFAELNTPQFWYIIYDDTLLTILGEPITFELIQPEFHLQPYITK